MLTVARMAASRWPNSCFADDRVPDVERVLVDEFRDEGLDLATPGAVADGDGLGLVLPDGLEDGRLAFVPFLLGFEGIDDRLRLFVRGVGVRGLLVFRLVVLGGDHEGHVPVLEGHVRHGDGPSGPSMAILHPVR